MSATAVTDALTQLDSQLNILMLVQGTLADGSAHYAYASIPPSRYTAFKEAEAKGHYDLGQFGVILAHGEGKEPSAAIQRQMEQQYGIDHQLEASFQAWLRQTKNA